MNVKKYSYIMTRKGNDIMNKKYQYILFLPCIVLISYFMIIPLLGTILPTFTDASNGMFSVYTDFFKDEYMMSILCRTIKVSLISSIICMLIGKLYEIRMFHF